MNINNAIDKEYESLSLREILKKPVSVLQGLSERQADLVKEAFRISTVEQFAKLRFAKWSWAIEVLEHYKNESGDGNININNAVDKDWEEKSLTEILNAPMHALQGLSERQADLMYEAFKIKSVKQLANLRFIKMARSIYYLALCEDPNLDPNK